MLERLCVSTYWLEELSLLTFEQIGFEQMTLINYFESV